MNDYQRMWFDARLGKWKKEIESGKTPVLIIHYFQGEYEVAIREYKGRHHGEEWWECHTYKKTTFNELSNLFNEAGMKLTEDESEHRFGYIVELS